LPDFTLYKVLLTVAKLRKNTKQFSKLLSIKNNKKPLANFHNRGLGTTS